jgi:hypothetical protein
MRLDNGSAFRRDTWLEHQLRLVEAAGRELAKTVGQVNVRTLQARAGGLGRRRRITEGQLRTAESASLRLREVQANIQNALFDCEHELRSLREREVSPAELLIDGERLISQYRFLRRRARVIDGLMAYLPSLSVHARACVEHLRRLHNGEEIGGQLLAPDCGFAVAALEELEEEDPGPQDGRAARYSA